MRISGLVKGLVDVLLESSVVRVVQQLVLHRAAFFFVLFLLLQLLLSEAAEGGDDDRNDQERSVGVGHQQPVGPLEETDVAVDVGHGAGQVAVGAAARLDVRVVVERPVLNVVVAVVGQAVQVRRRGVRQLEVDDRVPRVLPVVPQEVHEGDGGGDGGLGDEGLLLAGLEDGAGVVGGDLEGGQGVLDVASNVGLVASGRDEVAHGTVAGVLAPHLLQVGSAYWTVLKEHCVKCFEIEF